MLSTVAMATEGQVNVYEETPEINGLYDTPKGTGAEWKALDLSSRTPDTVRGASEVLDFKNHNTPKQAMVITGYIIPKDNKTGFYFRHDDGVKVFINNQDGSLLVNKNNWKLTGETQLDFTESLEINKVYPFRIEYFDWGGTEVLKTDLPMNWFHDTIPSYTVRYLDGESVFDSKDVDHGLLAEDITGPTKEGFVFDGWLLDGSPYVFTAPVLGNLDLTASWVEDYNLWVSVDDAAEHIYVNGQKVLVTPDVTTGNNWDEVSKTFVYSVGNNPFVAAKASDVGNVIVGFNLVLEAADGSYVETNDDEWYYYYNPDVNDGVPASFDGLEWYDEDYAANGWQLVSAVPPHKNWVNDSEFPAGATKNEWIWSPNFLPNIDTPVYLRSAQPKAVYNVSFDTLGATPETTPAAYDVASGTVISVPSEVPVLSGYTFTGWDYNFADPIVGITVITAIYEEVKEEEPEEPEQPEEPTQPTPQVVNYDLTVEVTEGGSVPGFLGTNTFASGTNVNLTVVAEDGYVFTGWTGDVTDGLVVMNADKTVVANFELILEDEETPEATPGEDTEEEVEEILDEVTPEATPEEDIQDEALPQTGGVPASMMSLLGIAMTGVGYKIKKRK